MKTVFMFENCKSYQEAIRIVFGKNYITTQLKEKLIRYCKETLGVDICSVIEENKKPKILYCKNCGKELSRGQKLFCSHSCSAAYNNKGTYLISGKMAKLMVVKGKQIYQIMLEDIFLLSMGVNAKNVGGTRKTP